MLGDNKMKSTLDFFGGTTKKRFKSTGFFRIEKEGDKQWLVDPEGVDLEAIGARFVATVEGRLAK